MAKAAQMPGGAKAKGPSTDNGNRMVQLKASAGITSEEASKLAARLL